MFLVGLILGLFVGAGAVVVAYIMISKRSLKKMQSEHFAEYFTKEEQEAFAKRLSDSLIEWSEALKAPKQ